MSVDIGISSQTMASRINYNAPLKSVRTVRAVKIEQHDPPKVSGDVATDAARPSDADLMNLAGIAFAWENAPGHSKIVEQEKVAPRELKPPPKHSLAPPTSSKAFVVEVARALPPAAGASAESITPYPVGPDHEVPPPTNDTPLSYASSKVKSHHQLPPKPSQTKVNSHSGPLFQQSGIKSSKPRKTVLESVLDSGDTTASPRKEVVHAELSDRRRPRSGLQEASAAQDRHRHSSLTSTTNALHAENRPSLTALNRGSQNYFAERLQGARDFYSSERNSSSITAPNSAQATQPNSRMPTRPASEAGFHSEEDWDGDQTDLGDNFSHMNMKDRDGRCQVSVLDGEQQLDSNRHTDPSARDFILERFLPAAKAMVTESSDVADRRSSQESLSVSPPSGKGRSSLPGRSRFAFKDRFAEEEGEQEGDENDKLFKCKFPWQVSALKVTGPQLNPPFEPRSVEQSPSRSFDEGNDEVWVQDDSEPSRTPSVDKSRSFEDRRSASFQTRRRTNSGSNIPTPFLSRSGEIECSWPISFSEESANGDFYEGEYSSRSNDAYERVDVGVRPHRLHEAATRQEKDRSSAPPTKRSPEPNLSVNLGTLLGITRAPVHAASIGQEPIPPSSILNHHRNRPKQAASDSSSADVTNDSTTKPRISGNVKDEGIHRLKVPTASQRAAETRGGSGRSLGSPNDEVWERTGRDFRLPAQQGSDRQEDGLNTHRRNLSDLINDDLITPGWPLAKTYNTYVRTASTDSKDASSSSFSDHSIRSPSNNGSSTLQEKSSSEKYSPVSVLQPPLPKSPAESWLLKVRPLPPPVLPSPGTNWRGANQVPRIKKSLEYSLTSDSMDEKWEALSSGETDSRGTKPRRAMEQSLTSDSRDEKWEVPSSGETNWRGTKPKKFLEHSLTNDSMDMKWEVLVNSETAQLRNKHVRESSQTTKVGSHGAQ